MFKLVLMISSSECWHRKYYFRQFQNTVLIQSKCLNYFKAHLLNVNLTGVYVKSDRLYAVSSSNVSFLLLLFLTILVVAGQVLLLSFEVGHTFTHVLLECFQFWVV